MALRTTIAIVLAVAIAYLLSVAASAWHAASQPPHVSVWSAREALSDGSEVRREQFRRESLHPSDPRLSAQMVRVGSLEERAIFHGPMVVYLQEPLPKGSLLEAQHVGPNSNGDIAPRPGYVACTIHCPGWGKYGPSPGDWVEVLRTIPTKEWPGRGFPLLDDQYDHAYATDHDAIVLTMIEKVRVIGARRVSRRFDEVILEVRPDQAAAIRLSALPGDLALALTIGE